MRCWFSLFPLHAKCWDVMESFNSSCIFSKEQIDYSSRKTWVTEFFSRNLRETTLDPGHGDLWILDFPYFPVSLFCPGFKSDHALLAQGKGRHLKYQQELTIPACLQVLEKQQLSAPLISQRWCFYKTMCNKTMCMTEGINGWHFELVDIWRYSFTSSNSVLTFLNCARGQKVGKCQV